MNSKSVLDFVTYPLCITTTEKSADERPFETDTGAIVCVKGLKMDARALAIVESKSDYSLYVLEWRFKISLQIASMKMLK